MRMLGKRFLSLLLTLGMLLMLLPAAAVICRRKKH